MAKPTIDETRFGVTGANVDSTQVSDVAAPPSSGLRDTGWADHATPTAKTIDYLFRKVHKWFQYLDGLIDGAEKWTFPAAVAVTTNQTVGGTLGVTGLITATAGLTAGANQHIAASGTGLFKHGSKPYIIPARNGFATGAHAAAAAYGSNNGSVTLIPFLAAGVTWSVPIALPLGATLLTVKARVQDSAVTPTLVRAFLRSSVDDVPTDIDSPKSSSGAGTYQTLTFTANVVMAANTIYFVIFDCTGGTDTVRVHHLEVAFSQT